MSYTEAEIRRWEEIIRDRDEIAYTLTKKLVEFLEEYRDGNFGPIIKDSLCPIKCSWKPSEKALKSVEIINDTIAKLKEDL